RRGARDQALEHQVQREVAGAGAQLECVLEMRGRLAQRGLELAPGLRTGDGVEVDTPLRVVAGGRAVVIADVDVADLGGGEQGHRGELWSRCPGAINARGAGDQAAGPRRRPTPRSEASAASPAF